jgi:hypothetical protein
MSAFCVLFDIITAIKKQMSEVKSKSNGMLILSIFLAQKLSKFFPRKTHVNLMQHLQFLTFLRVV